MPYWHFHRHEPPLAWPWTPATAFVYVSNAQQNSVSAYIICTGIPPSSTVCQYAKYSLQAVAGSPFNITGQVPGPLAVDAYANFLCMW